MRAIIGLGSNLGERREHLEGACASLARLCGCELLRRSSFYETAPFGVPDVQPDYINMAAELRCRLSPQALLGACLGIEAALGRERPAAAVKSARVIDIDLLLCEDDEGAAIELSEAELTLPHPRMLERAFVLVPLLELFPAGAVCGVDFSKELEALDKSGVKRLFS